MPLNVTTTVTSKCDDFVPSLLRDIVHRRRPRGGCRSAGNGFTDWSLVLDDVDEQRAVRERVVFARRRVRRRERGVRGVVQRAVDLDRRFDGEEPGDVERAQGAEIGWNFAVISSPCARAAALNLAVSPSMNVVCSFPAASKKCTVNDHEKLASSVAFGGRARSDHRGLVTGDRL